MRALETARGQLLAAQKPRPEKVDESLPLSLCFNCARYKVGKVQILTNMYRTGPDLGDGSPTRSRCRHCYDWTRNALLIRKGTHPTEPHDPAWPLEQPGQLVILRDRGERITIDDVAEVIGQQRKDAATTSSAGADAAKHRAVA